MPSLLSSFSWSDAPNTAYVDDLADNQRWSTWDTIERLCRGPEPWPDWVVTAAAAIDTDLGLLKSGKEADVSLVERAVPDDPARGCVMAAKRYRSSDRKLFHRDTSYTEGRRVRNSRDNRAVARRSAYGRAVESGLWARAEWNALTTLYAAGVPVPYPVQIDGTEILMEFIADGDAAAPRLHQTSPSGWQLGSLFSQLLDAMQTMARLGLVHGDLSPYNTLVTGIEEGEPRLVIIDVPQLVDLASNPNAFDLLHRDCVNMATWFSAAGHAVDAEELLGEVLAHAC
ncbi:serine/threonine protein kinase [Tessaracoccus sp. OS52]|uniref:serine protein kinase RIO n=1 Tax=Tessaracoccus sp. OS52 TaxID=2886691 RepID=UPI001D11964E|nr:RIO1 family regulatory kinase/ATPase [Tessaracoccus sp. OS52]MCC2591855.1 serine/threonine protein kinase [Tessaracoccus sp. OS52]